MLSNPSALLPASCSGQLGLGVFMYGKKMASWKALVICVALIAYPYFVPRACIMMWS